jgi:hypothetical protein
MKNLQLRSGKQIDQLITRVLVILVTFGLFGSIAYSQITATIPASRCGEGTLVLSATASSGNIKWYDVPFYGTPVGTGTTFTTPVLAVTKTYYVDAIDASSYCSLNSGSARVQVIATISASSIQTIIFYSSNTFCKSVDGTQTITRSGTAGGSYTVSPLTGLTLDASTGSIIPGSSTTGTYTVTYTVTAAAGCTENPASTDVTITTIPAAPVITYTGSPYCTTAVPVSVIQTGAGGGIYSASPSGLTINTSTGTITPSSSSSGTYIITYFVPGAGGCSPQTTTASISINTASVGGTATPSYSPISAGTGTTISVTGYNGTIQWQQSANGTDSWATVSGGSGATSSTYTTPNLSATTYYRVVVTNGICSPAASTTATVVVNAVSVAGNAASTQNICYGFTASLTLTGYTGTIQWQTNASGSFVDINGAISNTYTTPALTATTSYQAVVTNGVSAPAASNSVQVTVIPTSLGGSVNGTAICSGTSTELSLSEYIGTMQWQSNSSGTFADIEGATSATYTTPALTVTTSYKVIVTNTPCSSVESTVAIVTVDPVSAGGTATANPSTICSGGAITLTLTGYTGTIQWQTNASGSFADIKGETSTIYTTPALTTTTSYRAVVTNGVCGSANSTTAVVTVVADPTLSQPSDVSICLGGTTTLATTASGGTGTYSYQWQYSDNGTTGWANVVSNTPTQVTYTDGTATSLVITGSGSESAQANYYKCVLTTLTPTGAGCGAETTPITLTVVADPSISVQPAATTSECIGGTVQLSVTAGNGTPSLTYQWYSNTSASETGSTLLTNAANSTYTPVTTGAGTTYYYVVVSAAGNGCTSVTSGFAEVIVNALPTPTFTDQPGATAFVNTDVTYTTENEKSGYVWIYPGTLTTDYTITSGGGNTNSVTLQYITTGSKTVTINYTDNGCTAASATSSTATTVSTPLAIGDAYQGGRIAYFFQSGDPGYVSGETHGLIAALADIGAVWSTAIEQCYGSEDALTSCQSASIYTNVNAVASRTAALAMGMGQANTAVIIALHNAGSVSKASYAAGICDDYTNVDSGTGVYSDWYLPSYNELNKLRINKLPIFNYNPGNIWSSSENSDNTAWTLRFDISADYDAPKASDLYFRPVRNF